MTPTLSILIPSIPERSDQAMALYQKLEWQAASCEAGAVELLLLMDNRQRSVGMKRQALLDIACGDYIVYVDDDDDVADGFAKALLMGIDAGWEKYRDTAQGLHVVCIQAHCYLEDDPVRLVRMRLGFENEQPKPDSFRRKPWMCCAWRRLLALTSHFPDKDYGEDAAWLAPLWRLACNEYVLFEPLYIYRWSAATSATLGAAP